jgi:hypothetical protein
VWLYVEQEKTAGYGARSRIEERRIGGLAQ